jgi:HK97 family phage prohead protease
MLAPNTNDSHRPRAAIHPDGSVEGYASLFGEIDQSRDMVMPGAFARTLRQRGIRRIPMLFQHDPAEPIGIWQEIAEDWRGLRVRGRLIPEVVRARELLALLREGAADGLSIGFKTVRAGRDPKARIRRLHEIELWEISIVTFPLLPGARLRAVPEARARVVKAAKAPFAPPARARNRDPSRDLSNDLAREVREMFRGAQRHSRR